MFVTFEGLDGSGKSTQIARLANRLRLTGQVPLVLREPGSTALGEAIRGLIKAPPECEFAGEEAVDPAAELLLFEAARAQLVYKRILPALRVGQWVLCDRFFDSTTVYQGIARTVDLATVAILNTFASAGIVPDVTILLDFPARASLERAQKRSSAGEDRMEAQQLSFYEAVRCGYVDLARKNPQRFFVLDAGESPDTLEALIYEYIQRRSARA